MKPCEYAVFLSAIACFLFENMEAEDLEILAASLTQLGDTLATMLVLGEASNPASN